MNAIVDRHIMSHMRSTLATLHGIVHDWLSAGSIPEVDWARMRSLDFQEILRSRDALVKRLRTRSCVLCGNFDEHVGDNI